MNDTERDSLLAAAVLLAVCVTQRRYLFSWSSSLAYFFFANLVSGFIGVLLLPWVLNGRFLTDELKDGFGFVRWEWITDDDLSKTIVLYVGGALITLIAYRIAKMVSRASTVVDLEMQRDLNLQRLVLLLVAALIFVFIHVAMHPEIFLAGITSQLLADDKGQLNEFRRASTSNYAFVLIAYNVLPFLSTAMWLQARTPGTRLALRLFSVVSIMASVVVFVLTFLKLPLMIFLIGLGATEIARRAPDGRATWSRGLRIAAVLYGAMAVFGVLQGLLRSGESQSSPFRVAIREIIGRVSVSAPLYVHYFPNVAPHYGLAGIGLLARLLGRPVYEFTAVVYQATSGDREGSSTVCSILEFYCSFGWVGWIVGNALVGVLLYHLERVIRRIPEGHARLMAQIFMFVFCVHLAEASIFNAAFGYGGIFFLGAWLLIFRPSRVAGDTAAPQPVAQNRLRYGMEPRR